MKKKTLCFIPARSDSKEIRNKNLKKLNNLSLVEITIKFALKAKIFSKIILSSDSIKILNIGKKLGIETIKRSEKNSKDSSTTDAALLETMKNIKFDYNDIVIMQVTSPLRKIRTIKNFINYCKKNNLNTCCSISKIEDQVGLDGNFFNPIINNKNQRRRQSRKKFLVENGLLYFVKKNYFLKRKKIYPTKNWDYFETDKYESIDINNIDDFRICKLLYKKNYF